MFFLIFAVLFTLAILVLVALSSLSWFGLTSKAKAYINSHLSKSFDQQSPTPTSLNTQCCICRQPARDPVAATCSHSYCAECVLQYAEGKGTKGVECPACGERVCVLLRQFELGGESQRVLRDRVADYNFRNYEAPGVWRSLRELPNVLRNAPLLLSRDGLNFLITSPRVKIILVMLVYTLSPIDLLPESMLGPLGLFDDAFVIVNIFREVSGLVLDFTKGESMRLRELEGRLGG